MDALQIYIDEIYNITNDYKDVIISCYSGPTFYYSMQTCEKVYEPYYAWLQQITNKTIDNKVIIDDINVPSYQNY